jgi:hypothetical protein
MPAHGNSPQCLKSLSLSRFLSLENPSDWSLLFIWSLASAGADEPGVV